MRIRTVKPEIWSSASFVRLSLRGRLLFVGLLNYADDEGRGRADPALIRGALFPLELEEVSDADVLEWLRELHRARLVTLYRRAIPGSTKAVDLLQINGFLEHQVVSHPRESRYPAPRKHRRNSGNRSGKRSRNASVPNGMGMEQGKGIEGTREEIPESGAGSTPNGAGAYDPDAIGPAPYDEPIPGLDPEPKAEADTPPARGPRAWREAPNPFEGLSTPEEVEAFRRARGYEEADQ